MEREELSDIYTVAAGAVRYAGRLFSDEGRLGHVREKGLNDFVTDIDVAVQNELKDNLYQLAPSIQFMGEEQNNSDVDYTGMYWILDPVDGTTNLIHRFCHSTISLALAVSKKVVLGIVYDPYRDELFSAISGEGAYRNGKPISVSNICKLSDGLIAVGTTPGRRECAEKNFLRMEEIFMQCHDIRRIGAASLELCYVACGRLDGFFEEGLKPWDYAAAALIIEEAGGVVYQNGSTELALREENTILAGTLGIVSELQKYI